VNNDQWLSGFLIGYWSVASFLGKSLHWYARADTDLWIEGKSQLINQMSSPEERRADKYIVAWSNFSVSAYFGRTVCLAAPERYRDGFKYMKKFLPSLRVGQLYK